MGERGRRQPTPVAAPEVIGTAVPARISRRPAFPCVWFGANRWAKNVLAQAGTWEESYVSKEELVHLDGEVILIAKGGNFRVKLDNGHEVLAKLAGKVRRHRIRVVLGDRVTVAVSPYDPTRGFIVYRQR
jgi:translation initiation factor IF-1